MRERSFRVTSVRSRFGPRQSSISTTGLRSVLPSVDLMVLQSITGIRILCPPHRSGSLNSTCFRLSLLRSHTSREEVAAPVSMRAGILTFHGKRMTSSTAPRVIIGSAPTVVEAVRRRIPSMESDMNLIRVCRLNLCTRRSCPLPPFLAPLKRYEISTTKTFKNQRGKGSRGTAAEVSTKRKRPFLYVKETALCVRS